jgi:subtilisin family serine protease
MKQIIYILIILALITVNLKKALSQVYEQGALWVYVQDTTAIPLITQTMGGYDIDMSNAQLESLFTQYGVRSFERSFPSIDSLPATVNRNNLDRAYTLACTGNDSLLMIELQTNYGNEYDFIERIPAFSYCYTPNDYNLQNNIAIDWANNKINAQQAWNITTGSPSIKIGIVDQGFLATHEDIQPQIVYSGYLNPSQPSHGTFVAGLAAGATDNGIGKSSIGFNCKLMIEAIDSYIFISNKWDIMINMSANGANVLNASWVETQPSMTIQNIVNTITENGTLIVAAAGNSDSETYFYPASYDHVLSVTSTSLNDSHISPWGTAHTHNDKVDVCAPGYDVLSTCASSNDCYSPSSGTSFSSPIVSGLAGLVFSVNPNFTPSIVTKIIKYTCDNINDINPAYIDLIGTGRINAYTAVSAAEVLQSSPTNILVNVNFLDPNNVNEDIVLDGTHYIDEKICVYPGGKLTIKGVVFLSEEAEIIVDRSYNYPFRNGGELIIDGGVLLSAGDYLWNGIQVYGFNDKTQMQEYNGRVSVLNNSYVLDAHTAIKTTNENNDLTYSGGIVLCYDSKFINNEIATHFYPYQNISPYGGNPLSNISTFERCTFESNKDMHESVPDYFIRFNSIEGIDIKGCTFKNNSTLIFDALLPIISADFGNGIYSFNSTFNVSDACIDPNITPCPEMIATSFKNLFYSIYAIEGLGNNSVTVNNCEFTNTKRGIYLSGFDNSMITNNNFVLAYNGHVSTNPSESYGIYLDGCTNFTLEDNSFITQNNMLPTQTPCHGIIVNKSGDVNNEIYNNSFYRMRYAIQPQNQNRGLRTGLQLKCNEFLECFYDIAVLMDEEPLYKGIAPYQGTALEPAGNLFTEWFQNEYHIYNEGDPIMYSYHNNPTEYPVMPEQYSNNVFISMGQVAYDPLTSCPENSGGGSSGSESMLAEHEQLSNDHGILEQAYTTLMDDGNTLALETQVESATPATADEVKSELLGTSPYVSDSVLKTAVTNESAIDNSVLRDVFVENPHSAKSEDLLFSLLDRTIPMPDNLMAEILNGRFSLSEMETLVCNMNKLDIRKHKLFNSLLNHYMVNNVDSAKMLLENEGSLATNYKLAMLLFEEGNTAQATALLATIPSQFNLSSKEAIEYADYMSLINILVNNGQFSYQPDSLQLNQVAAFLNQASGRPATFARNMLISAGMIDYDEPILKPSPYKSSGFPYDRFEAIIGNPTFDGFRIYPNPAHKIVYIEYPLDDTADDLQMIIFNMTGTMVRKHNLDGANSHTAVDVSGIKPGVYVCKITSKGRTLMSKKLTIINYLWKVVTMQSRQEMQHFPAGLL